MLSWGQTHGVLDIGLDQTQSLNKVHTGVPGDNHLAAQFCNNLVLQGGKVSAATSVFDKAVRASCESCISICIRSGRLCFTVPARKASPVGYFPLFLTSPHSSHWLWTDSCNYGCLLSSAL